MFLSKCYTKYGLVLHEKKRIKNTQLFSTASFLLSFTLSFSLHKDFLYNFYSLSILCDFFLIVSWYLAHKYIFHIYIYIYIYTHTHTHTHKGHLVNMNFVKGIVNRKHFLSLRVFGLLSSSLLLFPQRFWPSSGVCRTQEATQNFKLRPLLNPQGLPVLIPLAITEYKC